MKNKSKAELMKLVRFYRKKMREIAKDTSSPADIYLLGKRLDYVRSVCRWLGSAKLSK